jgi:hypothetical protein
MLSVRKDIAPELKGPIPVKITSKCQYLLLSNRMLEDLLPVADGLEACAVPEPSVFEEEEDAIEELAAAVDNWAKPIDGGLERNTVYTFFCWGGLSVNNVCYPRGMITNQKCITNYPVGVPSRAPRTRHLTKIKYSTDALFRVIVASNTIIHVCSTNWPGIPAKRKRDMHFSATGYKMVEYQHNAYRDQGHRKLHTEAIEPFHQTIHWL